MSLTDFFIYSNAYLFHDGLADIKFLLVLGVAWRQKAVMIVILNFEYFLSTHTDCIFDCL